MSYKIALVVAATASLVNGIKQMDAQTADFKEIALDA